MLRRRERRALRSLALHLSNLVNDFSLLRVTSRLSDSRFPRELGGLRRGVRGEPIALFAFAVAFVVVVAAAAARHPKPLKLELVKLVPLEDVHRAPAPPPQRAHDDAIEVDVIDDDDDIRAAAAAAAAAAVAARLKPSIAGRRMIRLLTVDWFTRAPAAIAVSRYFFYG